MGVVQARARARLVHIFGRTVAFHHDPRGGPRRKADQSAHLGATAYQSTLPGAPESPGEAAT
jgi:hypothetical protein